MRSIASGWWKRGACVCLVQACKYFCAQIHACMRLCSFPGDYAFSLLSRYYYNKKLLPRGSCVHRLLLVAASIKTQTLWHRSMSTHSILHSTPHRIQAHHSVALEQAFAIGGMWCCPASVAALACSDCTAAIALSLTLVSLGFVHGAGQTARMLNRRSESCVCRGVVMQGLHRRLAEDVEPWACRGFGCSRPS